MTTSVVFLGNDATELEKRLNRAKRALPAKVQIGISVDGKDGPGAYGLNKKMTVTAIVAKDEKVTANFAIVQPSIAADAVKIGAAIAKVLGDEKGPTLQEMAGERMAMRGRGNKMEGRFRQLLSPVIQKGASQEEVDKAAKWSKKRSPKTQPSSNI